MRYQNWDVLLFPADSRIPIQEFKTTCHVLPDPEASTSRLLLERGSDIVPRSLELPQCPLVTCFVPGLEDGTPFTISIHNWDKPKPSQLLEAISRQGDIMLWEAKAYIDGAYVCTRYFTQDGHWPSVLTHSIRPNKEGECDVLHFPTFHHELLTQSWWNASENTGRIKIIISEGIARGENSSFDRVRQTVQFSWQHVPLDVLEDCGIAWPNSKMWQRLPQTQYHLPSAKQWIPEICGWKEEDKSPHIHTPSRRAQQRSYEMDGVQAAPPIPIQAPPSLLAPFPQAPMSMTVNPSLLAYPKPEDVCSTACNNGWQATASIGDPFLDDSQSSQRRVMAKSDESMPDYRPEMSVNSHSPSDNMFLGQVPNLNGITTPASFGKMAGPFDTHTDGPAGGPFATLSTSLIGSGIAAGFDATPRFTDPMEARGFNEFSKMSMMPSQFEPSGFDGAGEMPELDEKFTFSKPPKTIKIEKDSESTVADLRALPSGTSIFSAQEDDLSHDATPRSLETKRKRSVSVVADKKRSLWKSSKLDLQKDEEEFCDEKEAEDEKASQVHLELLEYD